MKYKWHGSGAIHTPAGVVEHGQEFEITNDWISAHPQRRWLKIGLITPVVEAPVPVEKKPVVKK